MIDTQRHQELLNRLSSEVKYNPSLAAHLEESMGYVCDIETYPSNNSEVYIGDVTNQEPY